MEMGVPRLPGAQLSNPALLIFESPSAGVSTQVAPLEMLNRLPALTFTVLSVLLTSPCVQLMAPFALALMVQPRLVFALEPPMISSASAAISRMPELPNRLEEPLEGVAVGGGGEPGGGGSGGGGGGGGVMEPSDKVPPCQFMVPVIVS